MTITPIRRALISVFDKTGIADFAADLAKRDVALLSSGGTATTLRDAGLEVQDVAELTGMGAILDHRVVTLHPKVHGPLLAERDKDSHTADLAALGAEPVDLLVVGLYPFRERPGIETIDVGGPAMIRAAAKNHAWVTVVTTSEQYAQVLAEIDEHGGVTEATRRRFALDAFAATAAFDAAIVAWMQAEDAMPEHRVVALRKAADLRYGENPHQPAARYKDVNAPAGWPDGATQHGGKELSFINVLDAQASWSLVHRFDEPACVIVKHANPCGVALGADALDAYRKAFACDDLSAFGGVVALNRPLSAAAAEAIADVFTEVVIVPGLEPGAGEILAAKKNLRVLEAPAPSAVGTDLRRIDGGFLVQAGDPVGEDPNQFACVTERQPTPDELRDLLFMWQVCAGTTSNAIVLGKDGQAYGIGAGQQSRVHAAEIAARKAGDRAVGGVCASDAFFPFRDGIDAAAAAGVTAVIQPGGSVRDDEVIAAANEHGIAMLFTSHRHFRH